MTTASFAVILAGVQAVAIAIWLVPASAHIVEWTGDAPHRVGLFASRSLLIWLSVAGLAAAGVLVGWARKHSVGRVAAASGWLCLLWLWAVPFLPWLPDRFPLLLVLGGPLRWLVAGIAIAGALTPFVGRVLSAVAGDAFHASFGGHAEAPTARRRSDPARWRVQRDAPYNTRRFVFVASLSAYLILGALHARAVGPGGDEPHYLVITHSLLVDRDLLIENNHTRRDYLAFWGGPLRPDYMRRGVNGEIYSIHAPGLPILLLPAYAAAGYAGAVVLLCLLAALAALAVFDLADALAGRRAALIAWAATCLTVPFVPHSWLIFPELPGALIVAWAALWLWRQNAPPDHVPTWLWRGIVLGTLPWLHTKFIIFLAVFGGALFLRVWRRPRAAGALIAPIVISVAAWLYSFYVIYGTFNPEAPYGGYTQVNVLARNIPRGLFGLLFDQKFGLLVYSPIYLFAIFGCWMMLRRADWRWLGGALLLATAVHVGSTTRLYMWWGGSSAPARFLVPILPCLAPMIAVAAREIRAPAARALLWICVALSVAVAISSLVLPERLLLFSDARGRGRIFELVQGAAPLTYLLPTFTQENWRDPLADLAPWMGAAALALAAIAIARRRQRRDPTVLGLTTLIGVVFLFSAAFLTAASVPPEGRDDTSRRGAVDLMFRYDANRLRALDYRSLRKLDQTEVLQLSTLRTLTTLSTGTVNTPPGATDSSQRMIAGPFTLPAGSYEARIWFADARPLEAMSGEIVVSSSERAVFGRIGTIVQNPAVAPFQLPVTVRRLTVTASGAATAVVKVELAPTFIVPPGEREKVPVRAIESLPNHPGAYVAYLDEHTYPEGGVFWTRGAGAGSVLVAPGRASRLVLTLSTGPRSGEVTVTVAGSERKIQLTAGETANVSAPIPAGIRLVPVTIQSSGFFRPTEFDPSSSDTRGLGCRVLITLE